MVGGPRHRASDKSVQMLHLAGRAQTLSLGGQHSAAIVLSTPSRQDDVARDDRAPAAVRSADMRNEAAGALQLQTWGYGEFGVLGHRQHLPQHYPRSVGFQPDAAGAARVVSEPAVSAGGTHTLALDAAGRVFACGRDEGEGRLGISRPPVDESGLLFTLHQVRTVCLGLSQPETACGHDCS
jgi:Regulator of chromosome condensation (RCC1) repeat